MTDQERDLQTNWPAPPAVAALSTALVAAAMYTGHSEPSLALLASPFLLLIGGIVGIVAASLLARYRKQTGPTDAKRRGHSRLTLGLLLPLVVLLPLPFGAGLFLFLLALSR